MKTIQSIITIICWIVLATACVPSPMYTPQTTIVFDWQQTTSGAIRPDLWTIRLYPIAGGNAFTLPTSATGFGGMIPPGIYNLLAFHPSTPPVEIADSSDYSTARLFIPLSAGLPAERAVTSADWHFSVAMERLEVKDAGNTSITLPVMQHVIPVTLLIKGSGLEYIRSLTGRLSGVATGISLTSGKTENKGQACCLFTFPEASLPLVTTFRLLGVVPESARQLSLSFVYTDGSTGQITVDVSDAFREANNQKHLPVSLACTVDINRLSGMFCGRIVKWEIVDMGEIEPKANK